ncbi:MAG: hypothetical protein A2279_05200 [Stygiobacter sp. RIFOXYA12_FULL_38_9]|nr:MAG: hypothetical protein A2X62_12490 [Stygiobacter sp. GWC2_38_9]OGU81191.1 MAG: hypothetical protein A2279_05200 [Stygiobacter sp. RIFOXYA12_FULL_38_9]OGV06321.1 MAG: hypothetical protein A2299_12940 [Stygiobacter sp. RIFOXYB2_FULL_37_11]OGV11070.1 MAG: hypothetical protein A2237_04500 [Stygiobacter sp. RIFOXYA2_FULL_38_8]OGV16072.1 MAG: hypothetical protein A2440_03865 [Stygiobacter sp. RIFOXYC2_FULL_38_25]OGV80549.1 MAG: hypothetical protein A2X65_05025 [Stygiobacter sp. GWF2_38_21]
MIEGYLVEKSLDLLLSETWRLLKKYNLTMPTNKNDLEEAINYHLRDVKNWSSEVSIKDQQQSKLTKDVYINLDLYIYPKRIRISQDERIDIIPFKNIFENANNNIILLGQPGAGKTTSMKHLCHLLLYDEKFHPNIKFPIVIRLREFNTLSSKKYFTNENSGPIFERLFEVFGFKIFQNKKSTQEISNISLRIVKEKIVIDTLNKLGILIILDGYDEIIYKNMKSIFIDEIRLLCEQLENSYFVLTSRSGDFHYSIDRSVVYEIAPLHETQMYNFALKWLGNKSKAENLIKEIQNSPFADTAIRPLNLAHLCAIYERIGKIPDKPKTVYKKIINLLLEEWDEQRSVKRNSSYANFETDRKFEFLSNLSFMLTTSLNRSVFSSADLIKVYKKIHKDFGLEADEMKQVVNELETHT